MTEADKKTFKEARPYVIGIVALLFKLRNPVHDTPTAFNAAERFIEEFEKRNA